MRRGTGARADGGRRSKAVAGLLLMLALAGCQTTASAPDAPSMPAGGGRTLAFESIDGPPEPVFHSLVAALAREAETRQAPVVSRHDDPTYRVRGYLAAHVRQGKAGSKAGNTTSIAFAWDVYDREARHVMRFTGDVPAAAAGRDAWAGADAAVLARIANDGLARLSTLLGVSAPAATETGPASAPRGTTPAIADDRAIASGPGEPNAIAGVDDAAGPSGVLVAAALPGAAAD